MPKSTKKQMNIDEKKVIEELRKNAKASIDRIGEKCGLSKQKVWRIIKKLENDKTIWGYNAVFDEKKLMRKRYLILIKRTNKPLSPLQLKIITSRKIKQVTSKLGINVEDSFYIHGKYDWFFNVTAKDISNVKKVIGIFTVLLKDIISEVDVQEVIFTVENNNLTNPNYKQISELF